MILATDEDAKVKDAVAMRFQELCEERGPGSQVCCRRMSACSCSLTLWCGLWLHNAVVGGLAYDVL